MILRRFFYLKRHIKTALPILAAVVGFLVGNLYSLYALERRFPTPLSEAQGDLTEIQLTLEQWDRGELEELRTRLHRQRDALVLAVALLSQEARTAEQRRTTARLLRRVALHRMADTPERYPELRRQPWEQAVEARVDDILRPYLEAVE